MKRQLSLGVNLTLRVGAVLVIVVGALILAFVWFSSQLQERLYSAVKMGTLAKARIIATDIAYELMPLQGEDVEANRAPLVAGVEEKLSGFRSAWEKEDKGAAAAGKGGDRFWILAFDLKNRPSGATVSGKAEQLFPGGFQYRHDEARLVGDTIIATAAAKAEGTVAGYIVYTESIADYLRFKQLMTLGMIVGLLFGLVFIVIGAIFVGRRAAAPINRIASTAQQMAAGELRGIALRREGIRETDNLSEAVSQMATALREQVVSTKVLALEATEMSQDVAAAMAHLASSAAQQAAAVAETASTVEEMEKAGKSVAENARQIVDAAEKTTEASIRGRQAVDGTSEIILKIKGDSQDITGRSKTLLANVEEIGNIIGSVNAIAEQSKILAVNASIEAAKAGEYGAGFAVVAQEVKDLAQQSKEATEQITKTLTGIRRAIEGMVGKAAAAERRTDEGVKMVANAGAIVNDLSEAIRENSEFANVIFSAITQQTLGLTQIASAVEEINSSASENQRVSRRMEQSTQHMSSSLQSLSDLVGRWKTADEAAAPTDAPFRRRI
ncbi:MAG: methyl-accepting chemotaxis protein [Proteobacteria bacterium]|nr:methyl-accepting chemotaxis protein [Pseudomonadota bacterium]